MTNDDFDLFLTGVKICPFIYESYYNFCVFDEDF